MRKGEEHFKQKWQAAKVEGGAKPRCARRNREAGVIGGGGREAQTGANIRPLRALKT